MPQKLWTLLRGSALGYVEDNCLSRGAAIAYYTVFALAPVLVIVIAVAGLVFGSDAARGAVVDRVGGLMGKQGAEAIQAMLLGAAHRGTGMIATAIGVVTLLVAASGVFGEMQATLNAIWKTAPREGAVWALIRARLLSLALVLILGLLLMLSLVITAGLAALDDWLSVALPGITLPLKIVNALVSFALIAAVFAAIYKTLPDARVAWRDVAIGAVVTALLFAVGKYLIALYIGSSSLSTSYGAAGALAVLLVWIYYSSQIFLFGAEFTRCFATTHGSWREGEPNAASGHAQEIAGLRERLDASRKRRASAPSKAA